MEVFDELMESEVSIVVPHITEIVQFCLEVCPHTQSSIKPVLNGLTEHLTVNIDTLKSMFLF